jgi:protein-S-isoprenylcysteine O-methyltransferase Ste14/prolipoprotein diacylglyceryltransferase
MNDYAAHLAFCLLFSLRWGLQLALAGRRALVGPKDLITASMTPVYLVLCTSALVFGTIGPVSVALMAASLFIRTLALLVLRSHFSYSVTGDSSPALICRGIYCFHRNPLLVGFGLEMVAFSLTLPIAPLSIGLIVLVCLVLCAWHAHEDNNRLASHSEEYRVYMVRSRNWLLDLVFPETARLVQNRVMRFDTYAAYTFVALVIGQFIALGYGVSLGLFLSSLPAAFLGALCYWKVTARNSKMRFGFSFIGGLLGAAVAGGLFLYFSDSINATTLAAVALAVSAAHGVGKIGCLAHGCCTGRPNATHLPYFVGYRDPAQRINRVEGTAEIFCAPTVVFEVLGLLTIGLIASVWPSFALPIWLIGYGTLRTIAQSRRIEAGDPTRVAPCAILIILGCLAMGYLPTPTALQWTAPTEGNVAGAIGIAALVSAAYGLRIGGQEVPQASGLAIKPQQL